MLRDTHCRDRPEEMSSSNLIEGEVKGVKIHPVSKLALSLVKGSHKGSQCVDIPKDDYDGGVMSSNSVPVPTF